MDAIPDIIRWAKKCQYLSSVDIIKSANIDGGKIDDRHPILLNMERRTLEYLYNQDHADPYLPLVGNYVLSLCGKYLNKAKSTLLPMASIDTAYFNGKTSGELPTEAEIFSWTLRSKILTDNTIVGDYSSFSGTPNYLFMAQPKSEPVKVKYYFSDDNKGSIGSGDSAWESGIEVGQFLVYVTKYPTDTGFSIIQFQTQ